MTKQVQHKTYHSILVANYFIVKAIENNTKLNPLKLIKLVYIAYGWYMTLTDGKNSLMRELKLGNMVRL